MKVISFIALRFQNGKEIIKNKRGFMSRTYKHRTKGNQVTGFLKYMTIEPNSFLSKNPSEEEKKENLKLLRNYRMGKCELNAPQYYKKKLNKSKKTKDKRLIHKLVFLEQYDNYSHPKWKKDAGWYYF